MKQYTKNHEWIAPVEGKADVFRIGITDYAQDQLGDVVTVELPTAGNKIEAGKECAVIESVKSASDIFAPISGEITAVNSALLDAPELVNSNAEDKGWLFEITGSIDSTELLDEATYQSHIS